MGKPSTLTVLLVLFAASIVFIGGFLAYGINKQQALGDGVITPSGGATSSGCNINPSVVNTVTDTLNPGTSVSVTSNYRLNGVYTGTTSPTTVGTADILFTNASYVGKIKTGVKVGCGSNQVAENLYAYTNSTLTYYSDNGLTSLTMDTVNETVKAAGGSYNWKLHMQGADKKSTGKQLLIVELSVPANVSSVTLNGGQSVAVPNGYARQLTNGYAAAFLLPEITGNTAVDYNLAVAAATAKVVQGTVYTTIYSVQPFVETDGTFSDSGLAFDSVNAAKWKDKQTKNFIIV